MVFEALDKVGIEASEHRLPPVVRHQLRKPDLDELALGRAAHVDVVVEVLEVRDLVAEHVVDRRYQLELFIFEEDDQHRSEDPREQQVRLLEAGLRAATI